MAISTFLINIVVQASLLLIGSALIKHGKLTGEILLAFMLYQGQLQVRPYGEGSAGTTASFLSNAPRKQEYVMNLLNSFTSLVKSSGAGDKVFGLLDRRPAPPGTGCPDVLSSEISQQEEQETRAERDEATRDPRSDNVSDGINDLAGSTATDRMKHSCSVEISNVSFTYASRQNKMVLKDFTLSIPQGKTVALVGSSGE